MIILIDNTTQAVTTKPFFPPEDQEQVGVFATGLSAGESVFIQFSIDGSTWEDLWQNGTRMGITNENNAVGLYAPVRVRFVKGVTSSPVTVAISTKVGSNFNEA